MKDYKLIKDYRDNNSLRASFNQLAENTFGLNFEEWYQAGFWGDSYNPHSVVEYDMDTGAAKVVANVSVNRMEFMEDGKKKLYIQLGTVMTDKAYRNQGWSRKLMEWVLSEFEGKADGIYLFANGSVLEFYPKFGFEKAKEYQYVKKLDCKTACDNKVPESNVAASSPKKVSLETPEEWQAFAKKIQVYHTQGSFACNNPGLLMFYASGFFKDCVYYIEALDVYAIAEKEEQTLVLYDIYAKNEVQPETVAVCFGSELQEVILGFTPKEISGYACQEYQEEDTTLFVRGTGFKHFTEGKKMFPVLSHA